MTDLLLPRSALRPIALAAVWLLCASGMPGAMAQTSPTPAAAAGPRVAVPAAAGTPRTADYILAVVNTELVTNNELQARLARIREDAARSNARLPPPAELRKQ